MTREEFLDSIGVSVAALAIVSCEACKKDSGSSSGGTSGPSNVDFTLDLTSSANSALQSNGGYMVSNGVIVARTTAGAYIAVQSSCTHESYTLIYQGSSSRFYCTNHGASFSNSGSVLNGPASKSLKVYNTTLTGSSLRVYS